MSADGRYTPEVAVAAAKLRVVSDQLLGKKTSDEVLRLSNGDTSVLRRPEPAEPRASSAAKSSSPSIQGEIGEILLTDEAKARE